MDTHRLRYFLRIAEEGSISRASLVLGVAQPALSRQLHQLEEDLGVTLFRRTSRGVVLTEEGERLRAATAGPLRQLELAVHYAGSPLARVGRGLYLGLLPTTVSTLAQPLLTSLAIEFPRTSLHLTVAAADTLFEDLVKGALDVAVTVPTSDDRVFCRELLVEDLVVVGGAGSKLEPTRPVSFTELTALPLVLPSSLTGIRTTLENAALRLKVRLSARYSTDSLEVAKHLMADGAVHGVFPISAYLREIEAGQLRYAPLREPSLTQQLVAAASSRLQLPRELAARIGEILREETARLTKSGEWPGRFLATDPWDPNRA